MENNAQNVVMKGCTGSTNCQNFFSEIRERLTYLFLIVIMELTVLHVMLTSLDPKKYTIMLSESPSLI